LEYKYNKIFLKELELQTKYGRTSAVINISSSEFKHFGKLSKHMNANFNDLCLTACSLIKTWIVNNKKDLDGLTFKIVHTIIYNDDEDDSLIVYFIY
jgi:hypothetical protein